LVRRLGAVEPLAWIRLMYLYPHKLPAGVLDLFAEVPKLVPYVEMPIQHIHDGILRQMNRGGTGAEIRRTLDACRRRIPNVAIRTSFIVGFPGETDTEFEQLVEFVAEQAFDRVAVFTYSVEDGTAAERLGDPVEAEVKAERRQRLLDLQLDIAQAKGEELVGARRTVLIDGPSQDDQFVLEGRMATQAPEIDGVVYLSEDAAEPGEFVEVEVTEALGYDLVGQVVAAPPTRRLPMLRRAGA
ncbi:MAG: radical SAM protein, partial [Nitrospiria bacterium]